MVKTSLDLFSLVLKQVLTLGDLIYQIGKKDYRGSKLQGKCCLYINILLP